MSLPSEPEYSICITHYNDATTVEESIASILGQLDHAFEVIVVDNFSTDGSYEVLKRLSEEGRITLYQSRCTRGRGRQLAFMKSRGNYIVANMDMDDIFLPNLRKLLELYHSKFKGRVLRVSRSVVDGIDNYSNVTISTRETIQKVGGWRDVNWYEDLDFWYRAMKMNLFSEITFPIMIRRQGQGRNSIFSRLRHRHLVYKEFFRTGLLRSQVNLTVRWASLPVFIVAWFSAKFHPLRLSET
jgi:glycosyltransferase involved in cell wall biosynthesis